MEFCEKLREARKKAGLSQDRMAEATGIPKRTIQDWEREVATPPEYLQRYVLCDLERLGGMKTSVQPMKAVYPVILTPTENGYVVSVPDFNINTQGDSLTEAIEMARDAICLMGIDMQADGLELPIASKFADVRTEAGTDIVTLVDVDFAEYRLI